MMHLSASLSAGARPPATARKAAAASRRRTVSVTAILSVRPYTIRKGDTLNSICRKRDLSVDEVLKLNHDLNPDHILAGATILLPAGKLSERDLEIIDGLSTGNYRNYPVRVGEKLEDILEKRGITMKELKALNPDLNPEDAIQANQVLRLPANKFTVREQEMLTGSSIVPKEFFATGASAVIPSMVFGMILGATGAYWYFKEKAKDQD